MTNSTKAAATDNKATDPALAATINDAANGTTTTSGDAKGGVQTIDKGDVGNLNDVLGNLANAATTGNTTATLTGGSPEAKTDFDRVYKEGDAGAITSSTSVTGNTAIEVVDGKTNLEGDMSKDNTTETTGTPSTEVKAPEAATGGSISDMAAGADKAVATINSGSTGGTTTQRAEVAKINSAPMNVEVGVKDGTNGAVAAQAAAEKKTVSAGTVVKSTAAVTPTQLPEVVAAMEVAKMQTVSALNNILEYCRNMHPGQPQTVQSIEKHQVSLLVSLKSILIAEDVNFNVVFKAVVAIVKAHRKDAFAITMRNRGLNGINHASIDNVDMRFLTRLVDALHTASGVNDIATVKTLVDMNKLLGSINNIRAKNNLTAFFS